MLNDPEIGILPRYQVDANSHGECRGADPGAIDDLLRGSNETKPTVIAIGERRPDPRGIPGYLRIDSVHQGDWNGVKGGVSSQRRG